MTRKIIALLGIGATFAVTACGADDGPPAVTADAAKAGVERAAGVTLASEALPSEAKQQGLQASYTNAGSIAKDKQVVALFVVKNDDLATDVAKQVRQTVPSGGKLIVDGNVMVVYANAGGTDKSTAVEQAVKAL